MSQDEFGAEMQSESAVQSEDSGQVEAPESSASAMTSEMPSESTEQPEQGDDSEPEVAQPPSEPEPPKEVPYDVAFRLTVYYDIARGEYGARCEELGDLEVFGATREEAMHRGEAMLESKIAAYAVRGDELPKPFDLDGVENYSGHLDVQISKTLHRKLAHSARRNRISVDKLVGELLGFALGGGAASAPRPARHQARRGRRDEGDDRRGRRRGLSRDRYNEVMEDKAAFLEYVRSLDREEGGRGGRGRGRGRR